jgi:hypothetical protein
MTDTFGHALNYCWLKRFKINAKNLKGALIKLSRETGLNFRNNCSYYKAKNACIGAYELEFFEPEFNKEWLEKAIEL